MPRFKKGTTDHDGDGKMGGSMKETDMASTKKPASKAKDTEDTGAEDSPLVAMEAKAREAAGDDPLKAVKEQKAEFNRLFAKADAEAQAAIVEERQAGLQVRGY
jgi:hypothetical protein